MHVTALRKSLPLIGTFCCWLTLSHPAWCVTPAQQRISFRTVKPAAAHFKSEKEALANEKTLKQIGCATKRQMHDGHVDVVFECKLWKSLSVKNAEERDNWYAWLSKKGFAVVENTPAEDHKETVRYQLPEWRTHHFHDPKVSAAHAAMFKMLGCEVKVSKHNGHDDVTVRSGGWQAIGLPNHREAHAWMTVLKNLGFAVTHEH